MKSQPLSDVQSNDALLQKAKKIKEKVDALDDKCPTQSWLKPLGYALVGLAVAMFVAAFVCLSILGVFGITPFLCTLIIGVGLTLGPAINILIAAHDKNKPNLFNKMHG